MTPLIDRLTALEAKATKGRFVFEAGDRGAAYGPAIAYTEEGGHGWPVEFHTADMDEDAELYVETRNALPLILQALKDNVRLTDALAETLDQLGEESRNTEGYIRVRALLAEIDARGK